MLVNRDVWGKGDETMSEQIDSEDRPINLEESSSFELKRVVVADDDGSTSTLAPVWVPKPHPDTRCRELLGQPFGTDPAK
jgi:hypothetical protein